MNITRILLQLFLLLACIELHAQSHYLAVGNFTDAMNINILEAKVNGVDLEKGDEIGIFSNSLCVGNAVLDNSLEGVFDAITISAVAGSDDAETAEVDGFITGDSIIFKYWDFSEQEEIAVTAVKFYDPGDGSEIDPKTFQTGATVFVSLNSTYNYKPKSDAGSDQFLNEGETGRLDGTGSSDLNQDSLSFFWQDIDSLGLVSFVGVSPTFTTSKVESDKDFRVVLIVSDGVNESEPDTVIITVLNVLSGPVANAGTEWFEVNELEVVYLDGSKSFDPDGLSIYWHWELSNNAIDIVNRDSAHANFVAPAVQADTTLYVVLTVTNAAAMSNHDTVLIYVKNVNEIPVAIAVSVNETVEGELVTLVGSSSYDPDGGPSNLTYEWQSLNGGEITDDDKMNAVFHAPWLLSDSTFYFSLVVYDGNLYSHTDTLAVRVLHANLRPIANAGDDSFVAEGEEFILSGKSSFDPESNTLQYEWNSDFLILDDIYSSDPNFVAPEVQKDTTVFITLKVSDQKLWSEADTVWITIQHINKNPDWITLPTDSVFLGRSYAGSIVVSDPDLLDTIVISVLDLPFWLSFIDHGNGMAELRTDSIPREESLIGNWEIALQASDGTATIDTVLILHVDFVTGISEPQNSFIKVFPNPVHDWMTIQLDDPFQPGAFIRLYNTSGILISEKWITNRLSRINLADFSKGIYLLEIEQKNKPSKTFKVLLN